MHSRPLLIVLNSLVAEGCPQLALQLARHWRRSMPVELVCLCDQPADLLPEFQALRIPIHVFSLGSGLARYPRLLWLSYWLCRRIRPQAVLSFPLGWHTFIAIGARLAGVRRTCAHVGNLPPVWSGLAFTKFKALVQLGRPFTHRLICCSAYIYNAAVRDFSLSRQEARVIFNACDISRFISVKPDAVSHQSPRLGMVARLEQHKDHPNLIRAIAILRDQGISAELWIVGEGSRRPQLMELIQSLHLEGQVQLLGSRRDIPELLSQLDLFVFSALRDEGFGIALAEAMAIGLPIIATDVGACREVLDGGRCGLLVEPGDPAALAEGIHNVLADPAAAQQRVAAAKEKAFQEFSVAAMADAYGDELGFLNA